MRIGIYGGTFDPPHLGHLILADEARNQLQIDRLLWVLAAHPPHKQQQEVSPLSQRLELIRAAIASEPCFELSTVDIDRAGPHYALDTVRIISAQFPGEEITYIMGGDSLRDLPNWHMPLQLMQACTWIGVMRRPDDDVHLTTLEKCLPGISAKVMFLDAPRLEISSSQIRLRIAEGRPFRYYLPVPVFDLVVQRGYYRAQER